MQTTALEELERTVAEWPGVSVEYDPDSPMKLFATFMLGKREVGHLHLAGVAHVPFPRDVREELYNSGQARPHSAGIKSHVEVGFEDGGNLEQTLSILRMSYDRALKAAERHNR